MTANIIHIIKIAIVQFILRLQISNSKKKKESTFDISAMSVSYSFYRTSDTRCLRPIRDCEMYNNKYIVPLRTLICVQV